MPVTEQDVLSALKSCYDPEIPVNIVDLGLIYSVKFDAAPEDKQDQRPSEIASRATPRHPQRRRERCLDPALVSRTPQPRRQKATRHRVTSRNRSTSAIRNVPALSAGH
jgi:hypothetical protein